MESMTGFGSASAENGISWTWTIRSVNGKTMDVRVRLPSGYDFLEQSLREALRKNFVRGSFTASLEVSEDNEKSSSFVINEDLLKKLCRLATEYQDTYPHLRPASIDGLMNVRGVVESAQDPKDALEKRKEALIASLEEAVKALKASRRAEGIKMEAPLTDQIDKIEELIKKAQSLAGVQPERIKNALKERFEALKESVSDVSEDRFLQEVSVLMLRADVREELDRLEAHVKTARELLLENGAVGKKIDFLCQEFNRETNTLCSKSSDIELTRIGMALKSVIDQFREQIQNIE